ncbi:MAG TPA: glycosyltransferase family 9 protein [Ktedonobacterales bacterium]
MIDPRWHDARRVLLVRLDNLGDVLVTTPAFHAVREALPSAHLTLLASPVGAQVGRLNPDLDEVIVYSAPWMDPWHTLPQESARELAMVETVRAGRYDGAIIFTSYHQSPLPAAYLCYLADIPLRAAASIDGPGSLLTTRHKHPERMMHEVERGLDLVGALGMTTAARDLVLRVPAGARERMRARVEAVGEDDAESRRIDPQQGARGEVERRRMNPREGGRRVNPRLSAVGDEARLRGLETEIAASRRLKPRLEGLAAARSACADWEMRSRGVAGPLVVVHPGCSMPARTYPWERFAQVIDLLVAELGARVALTGADDEAELVGRVYGRLSARARRAVLPLAGALAFDELCALIEAADLTITNNTGPMHIAAAVKTPVVVLFALTNPPEQWGPWQVPHRQLYHEVACRLCYACVCPYGHECLTLVTPGQVIAAARELLAEAAAGESADRGGMDRGAAQDDDARDEGACHAPLRTHAPADRSPACEGRLRGATPLGAGSPAGPLHAARPSPRGADSSAGPPHSGNVRAGGTCPAPTASDPASAGHLATGAGTRGRAR